MALTLSNKNWSDTQIMALGRWKSTAFREHIRPQVMEWFSNMAQDMTEVEDFRDLGSSSPDGFAEEEVSTSNYLRMDH